MLTLSKLSNEPLALQLYSSTLPDGGRGGRWWGRRRACFHMQGSLFVSWILLRFFLFCFPWAEVDQLWHPPPPHLCKPVTRIHPSLLCFSLTLLWWDVNDRWSGFFLLRRSGRGVGGWQRPCLINAAGGSGTLAFADAVPSVWLQRYWIDFCSRFMHKERQRHTQNSVSSTKCW